VIRQTPHPFHHELGNPGINPFPPNDMLFRWDWLDKSTVEAIVNSTSNLHNLTKLFREHTDRDAHILNITAGIRLPADRTQPYVVILLRVEGVSIVWLPLLTVFF
jgi:hypothetical protein